jgi:hypothetical protein
MTAPTPDPGALLDRLEEARKAALAVRKDYPSLPVLNALHDDDADQVIAVWSDGATADFVETFDPESADLIAAAINHLPDLIRLARDGLALRAGIERLAEEADARVRASVPASAAERLIADGAHTVKVGDLRAVVADTSGEAKQ